MATLSAGRLFVTGASGFIGGAVCSRLLLSGRGDTLTALVRASTRREGLVRLRSTIARFGVPRSHLDALGEDQIVCGDLGNPSAWIADGRMREVTHVLNCGASTAFTQEKLAWDVNCHGTLQFARSAAKLPHLQRFVHVGTAMSCGPDQPKIVPPLWDSAPRERHLVAYTASKAAFDNTAHALLPDLPLVVARPSIVLGDTRFGCQASTSIYWILRAAREIGGFTCALEDHIDIVPVDWVAEALDRLVHAPALRHDLYHLSAGVDGSVTFREIDLGLAAALDDRPLADRYRHFDYRELARTAREVFPELAPRDLRIVARALALYGEFARLNYRFDNSRILAEGVPCPPRLTEYLAKCVQTAEAVPLIEQVRYDVKGLTAEMAASAVPA